MPTVVELILYGIITLAVILYIIRGIYVIVDRKKHPSKYEKKEEERKNKLDE